MLEVNSKEFRSKFSSMLDMMEQGEEIIITRRKKKIARLVPVEDKSVPLKSLKHIRKQIKPAGNSLGRTVILQREQERY